MPVDFPNNYIWVKFRWTFHGCSYYFTSGKEFGEMREAGYNVTPAMEKVKKRENDETASS